MNVEILSFDGCPNAEGLPSRIRALLAVTGIEPTIEERRVGSAQEARDLRFLGSPTIRLDGLDVEPGAGERADFGLKCRLYRSAGRVSGQPSDELILAAARGRASGRVHAGE